jgi:hypothetical protein
VLIFNSALVSPVHVVTDVRGDTCTKNDFRQDRKVEEGRRRKKKKKIRRRTRMKEIQAGGGGTVEEEEEPKERLDKTDKKLDV